VERAPSPAAVAVAVLLKWRHRFMTEVLSEL